MKTNGDVSGPMRGEMSRKKVLITGGAGFVGSHLADALLARGHKVRIFDNLAPQVHGSAPGSRWL